MQLKIKKVKRFKFNFKPRFLAIFLIIFCCEISVFLPKQQAFAAQKSKHESPTRIRSDIIDIKRKSQTVDFLNNVVIEKDDSSLLAKKMTIFYEEDKKLDEDESKSFYQRNAKNKKEQPARKAKIKIIEAKENVKIFSEEFIASGDFGYYDPQKNIFVLVKNVIVNNGTSIASGDKFIYSLETKKGKFIGPKDETSIRGNGGDKRVVVVIGDDLSEQKKEIKKSKK